MADDLAEGCDGLQLDMAEHQRRFGKEVTASENQTLAATAFERLDRERQEAKPAQANYAPPVRSSGTEIRDGKHGRYVVSKSATDDVKCRSASPAEHWFMTHAMPRIDLLLSKLDTGPLGQPSWSQRAMAVMQLQMRAAGLKQRGLFMSAADASRRFMFELVELLEASSAVFGDWKKDAVVNPRVGWTPSRG